MPAVDSSLEPQEAPANSATRPKPDNDRGNNNKSSGDHNNVDNNEDNDKDD